MSKFTVIKRYCSVFGCLNNSLNPKLSFFSVPVDKERRLKWLRLIDREDLINKTKAPRVCEAHFDVKDIILRKNRNLLKKNCFPRLHLPETSLPSDPLGKDRETDSGHPTTSSSPEECLRPSTSDLIDVEDLITKQVIPTQSLQTVKVLPLDNAPLAKDFSDEDVNNERDPYDTFALSLAEKIRSVRDVDKRIRLMNALLSMVDNFLADSCITNTLTAAVEAAQEPVYIPTRGGVLMMSLGMYNQQAITERPPLQQVMQPASPGVANQPVQMEIQPNLTQQSIPPLHFVGSKPSSIQTQENMNRKPPVKGKNITEDESATDSFVKVPVEMAKITEFALNKTPKTSAGTGTGNEPQALASIAKSMMDQNNELDDELQRKRKLANACLKRHRKKKREEHEQKKLLSQNESEYDEEQMEQNRLERRRELAKERSKRYRDKKRLFSIIKTEPAITTIHNDTQTPGPSHGLIKNVPFVYDPIPIKSEVVEFTDDS